MSLDRPTARQFRALLCVAWLAAACGGDDPTLPDKPAIGGSFARLQSEVLSKNCAVSGCHISSTAASGSLALTPDVAYDNLVNALPTQLNARQDGLRRVVPGKVDSSLLYLKLLDPPRFGGHDYGNVMPVGAAPLSAGQVEFVLQWIAAGAPRNAEVADARLLSLTEPQSTAGFTPLTPPAPGTGVQVKVDPFVTASNFERELFVYRPLGNTADIYVRRVEFKMRPNSHHFVMYTFDPSIPAQTMPAPNTVRDIRNPDGSMNIVAMFPMAYHVFFGGSMQSQFAYDFPPGVAFRLPASAGIDMNVHYVNRTTSPISGEAYANLYTTDVANVQHVAKALNLSNTSIALPPNQRTTLTKSFLVSQPMTIFALTSHMHMLGEQFVIKIVGGARDGEIVYDSADWQHPQMLFLNQPIVLQPGQGLRSVVTWNNTTGHTVNFGLLSTDEMGIIFGYYY